MAPPPGCRLGSGPKDNLETPELLSRGTCFVVPAPVVLLRKFAGAASSFAPPALLEATEDAADPPVRFRLRTVTEDGMAIEDLGDARGGVVMGAGSLERAECTRASSRCI